MNFTNQIIEAIYNMNNDLKEAGQFVAYSFIHMSKDSAIIQKIELNDNVVVDSYLVNMNELEGPYVRAYEDEMDKYGYMIEDLALNFEVVRQIGTKLETVS